MLEYIERGKALKEWPLCDEPADAYQYIKNIPAADVVSRDAFNHLLAENDTMRAQLARIGKKPGDSMDDVRRVVLCRDCKHYKLDPLEQINACVKDADEVDGYYSGFMSYPAADWFCADGERESTK